ncbi:MAG: aminotransferase class I/II-fold pyridoxal phosphate-dependent enzyme [Campylobacterota bacterium]|nr:aminotransferase class I/II-fold pyridoxal phosphate-dependent enzyme [Campylobacterota bacterium]
MNNFEYYNTLLVQEVGGKTGAIAPAIVPAAAFGYTDAQEAEAIFSGEVGLPLYARVGNPTNGKLEKIVTAMEDGTGAIATSSGMGALAMVLTAFLKQGDEILCIGGFFGGTYTLVNETMRRFGVKSRFCDVDALGEIKEALQSGVQMVICESAGNPSLKLPDLNKIGALCDHYQTLFVVDNTITPLIVHPFEAGADIVIYSSTKIMSGHSAALGGIAVFRAVKESDKLYQKKYQALHPIVNKMKEKAMIAICKKRAMRDIGMTANAFGSFLTMLGLETLALRVERINASVETFAKILSEKLPTGYEIRHPSLPNHEHHARYQELYPDGCGSIVTLDCGSKEAAFRLLDRLTLITQTANIGDNRTLALHMRSTIYRDFDEETRTFLGVTEGLIRISIGLEDPQAIADDFVKAALGE